MHKVGEESKRRMDGTGAQNSIRCEKSWVPDNKNDKEVDNKDVDFVLSQELMKLSVMDRNAILEEIHGARCLAIKETPELIRKSLKEFQMELDKDSKQENKHDQYCKRSAYRLLLRSQQNSKPDEAPTNYALKDNFRLRFLRCELFDVSKAVRRYYNYLDYAHQYWGDVALERPIRLTDFSKPELKFFRNGFFQLLPFRDSSGRRVMVVLGGMHPHKDIHARNKIFFYLWDVVTRDSIESQQKGFIIVRLQGHVSTDESDYSDDKETTFAVGRSSPISFRNITYNLNRAVASIPSRCIALHTRVPNLPGFRLAFKLFVTQVFTDENVSLRSRFLPCNLGSDLEVRYQLKSYGIPTQLFPLTETDSVKCVYHNQWIKTRKLLEEKGFDDGYSEKQSKDSSELSMLVECPGLNDVVFRKGSRVTSVENPGNRFFRDLIRTFLEERERVSEQLKQEESDQVGDDSLQNLLNKVRVVATVTTSKTPSSPTTPVSSIGGKKNTGKAFCDWLVDYIEQERKGRFLEWNTKYNSWMIITDKAQILRKASITLYNRGKRLNVETAAAKKLQQQMAHFPPPGDEVDTGNIPNPNNNNLQLSINNGDGGIDDLNAYRFINGRRPTFEQQDPLCFTSFPWITPDDTASPTAGKKRPRNDDSNSRGNRPFSQPVQNVNF